MVMSRTSGPGLCVSPSPGLRPPAGRHPRTRDHERHAQQSLEEAVAVGPASMLVELLSVIGEEDDDGVLFQAELFEFVEESETHLTRTRLGEANADIQHIAYAIRRHETYPALVNVLLMAGSALLSFLALPE